MIQRWMNKAVKKTKGKKSTDKEVYDAVYRRIKDDQRRGNFRQ